MNKRTASRWAVGAVALLGAIAWFVVGRALRPVEAMRAEVAEITAQDLGGRVPVPRARDEIGRLATTMNDMLDRLQHSAERERRFVADASHELQSPLASSLADLEVALAHPESTEWEASGRAGGGGPQRVRRLGGGRLLRGPSGNHGASPARGPRGRPRPAALAQPPVLQQLPHLLVAQDGEPVVGARVPGVLPGLDHALGVDGERRIREVEVGGLGGHTQSLGR